MSQAPSMPMFWDAYLADTTHLTTEEHGAYLLLLAAMWRRNGWVPDDDRDNARILGLTPGKWRAVKARLAPFLIFKDGQITQKNLLKIWKNTQEKIEKNRANGAKGGRPAARENNDLAKANGSVSVNPNETIPEPEPDILPDTNVSGGKPPSIFDIGLAALVRRGVPERQARSITGKWRSEHGEDATLSVLRQIEKHDPSDPVGYGNGILRRHNVEGGAFGRIPERN